ncbi:hypothetical protein D3P09_00200 [Paenibacillus pinisoli]|uniref:Uncharacterized protein n=1 Tax=Paenibacillus pinisoli TaxID=1276110 RepID=A0A3A6Q3J4_9BACL|nr:hypothetical protein [Paenibacillus pinisoli]RJX40484.1 hypothetical protein D3P09_00200 [Paenibacillus pinisoli]
MADADNAVQAEIFSVWTNYSFILEFVIDAKTPEDYAYIVGRIDGPLRWSPIQRMKSLSNISQEHVDTLIPINLQEPLYKFVDNVGIHQQQIKANIEAKKLDELHKHDLQMQEIIDAVRELNNLSNRFLTDLVESAETLRILESSNMLIENVLNNED